VNHQRVGDAPDAALHVKRLVVRLVDADLEEPEAAGQRVVNGGFQVEREYAAGRGRMDLAVKYGGQWNIIEMKLVSHRGRESTITEGLRQVTAYRDRMDSQAPSYLVVFNRTPAGRAKSWEERLTWETVQTAAGPVTVVGG